MVAGTVVHNSKTPSTTSTAQVTPGTTSTSQLPIPPELFSNNNTNEVDPLADHEGIYNNFLPTRLP